MVGKTGFEPATSWSQTKRTAKLCYFPIYINKNYFKKMVHSKGIEPLTFWFVAKHSIQLSYECITTFFLKMVAPDRIELSTPGFSVLCSTDWATEPHNKKWRFRRDLNPRSSAWQADVLTTTPRNHIQNAN